MILKAEVLNKLKVLNVPLKDLALLILKKTGKVTIQNLQISLKILENLENLLKDT